MKASQNTLRIGIASAVIIGTIVWLAYTGYASSKSYYVKVPELLSMGSRVYTRNLRVDGFVVPGSIQRDGPHVDFRLNQFESHMPNAASGHTIEVSYKGAEPPPDTFKDDSEAVAGGTYGRDGVFHASTLQAKCASKYAPVQPGAPVAVKPASTASAAPASTPSASY